MTSAQQSMIGRRFGRLTVTDGPIRHTYTSGRPHYKYICQCDCGNLKEVGASHLRSGDCRSCGCAGSGRKFTPYAPPRPDGSIRMATVRPFTIPGEREPEHEHVPGIVRPPSVRQFLAMAGR